jgi:hypothetical protein
MLRKLLGIVGLLILTSNLAIADGEHPKIKEEIIKRFK